jgi:hypothetical protein
LYNCWCLSCNCLPHECYDHYQKSDHN